MLERLLELVLHAKAGVFAGILLVGTTGALVTATVATAGNVTTITLTQASASPSANVELTSPTASPTAKPTESPEATETPEPSPANPTTATTTTTCTPDQSANDAVKTVDSAFSMYHTDLMHLRTDNKGDAGKTVIANADKLLKQIRQDALKAIHATSSCKTDTTDEADKSETDTNDEDGATGATGATGDENNNLDQQGDNTDPTSTARGTGTDKNLLVTFFTNLFGKHGTTVTTNAATPTPTLATTTTTTVTGDAKTLADNAVAAMKLVFDSAKSDLDKLPTTNATPKPTHSPRATGKDTKKGDQSNQGKSGDD